jgi:hypothetical protein
VGLIYKLGSRLRAILILILLFGVVVIDSASRIISMCADGFLVVLVLLLIAPLLKGKSDVEKG